MKDFLYKILPFLFRKEAESNHNVGSIVHLLKEHSLYGIVLKGVVKRIRLHHDYYMKAVTTLNTWDIANKGDEVYFWIRQIYTTGEIVVVLNSPRYGSMNHSLYFENLQ